MKEYAGNSKTKKPISLEYTGSNNSNVSALVNLKKSSHLDEKTPPIMIARNIDISRVASNLIFLITESNEAGILACETPFVFLSAKYRVARTKKNVTKNPNKNKVILVNKTFL